MIGGCPGESVVPPVWVNGVNMFPLAESSFVS